MIKYIPRMDSDLWARKCQRNFEDIDDLKRYVSDKANIFFRFIGNPNKHFCSLDVKLESQNRDLIPDLKNYCNVILNGQIVGYCGE